MGRHGYTQGERVKVEVGRVCVVYGGDVAVGVRGGVDEAAGGAEEGVRLEACRGGSVKYGIGRGKVKKRKSRKEYSPTNAVLAFSFPALRSTEQALCRPSANALIVLWHWSIVDVVWHVP
jgi:hypothetical protein